MKRLAAFAVVVALSILPVHAQRGGGSHGGFAGSHAGGGFSAPRGGFSGGGGFSGARAPSFHGGSTSFGRSGSTSFGRGGPRSFYPQAPSVRAPFRIGGTVHGTAVRPPQYLSQRMPYPGRAPQPGRPGSFSYTPNHPGTGTSHRMPYHSPNGDHHGAWDHHGHDGGHDHHHHGVTFVGAYGWAGYPYLPWWAWNYPILPASWDYWGDNDSNPGANYSASQYPEYMASPYDAYPPDQSEPQHPEYTPWPYSNPAPPASQPAPGAAPVPEATVTLVFKDGRPNQRVHNYLLTTKTLSVLDENRREIPVDQLDLAATARVNREAGIEFALPAQSN